jgi:hypothetical protein
VGDQRLRWHLPPTTPLNARDDTVSGKNEFEPKRLNRAPYLTGATRTPTHMAPRTLHAARTGAWTRAACAVSLLVLLVACGSDPESNPESKPDPPATSATGASTPSVDPQPTPREVTPTPPPDTEDGEVAIVGTWSSTDPGDATFAYRFEPDGTYAWVGVITQPRASGTFHFQVQAKGRFAVRANRLFLTPSRSSRTRNDPDDPSGDYKNQPYDLAPSTYRFTVEGSEGMTLSNDSGTQHYVREGE